MIRFLKKCVFKTSSFVSSLKDVRLGAVGASSTRNKTLSSVEKCICPPGYDGLSCEVYHFVNIISLITKRNC